MILFICSVFSSVRDNIVSPGHVVRSETFVVTIRVAIKSRFICCRHGRNGG